MSGDDRFDLPRPGLIRQELVTYQIIQGTLYRQTTLRKFMGKDDYLDSYVSEPLYKDER